MPFVTRRARTIEEFEPFLEQYMNLAQASSPEELKAVFDFQNTTARNRLVSAASSAMREKRRWMLAVEQKNHPGILAVSMCQIYRGSTPLRRLVNHFRSDFPYLYLPDLFLAARDTQQKIIIDAQLPINRLLEDAQLDFASTCGELPSKVRVDVFEGDVRTRGALTDAGFSLANRATYDNFGTPYEVVQLDRLKSRAIL